MPWISDSEFKAKHKAHIASAWWKLFRQNALAHFKYKCVVCGTDYERKGFSKYQLIVDHKRYKDAQGNLIFGKETFGDVRICCPPHNQKGVRSDASMNEWRKSYRWLKAFLWFIK